MPHRFLLDLCAHLSISVIFFFSFFSSLYSVLHLYSLCKFVSCYSRSIRHLAVNSFPVFSGRLCTQCHRIPSQMKSTRRRKRREKNICANCVLDARFEQRKTPALSTMMEEHVKEKESTECCFKQCSCFPCRFLRKQAKKNPRNIMVRRNASERGRR